MQIFCVLCGELEYTKTVPLPSSIGKSFYFHKNFPILTVRTKS